MVVSDPDCMQSPHFNVQRTRRIAQAQMKPWLAWHWGWLSSVKEQKAALERKWGQERKRRQQHNNHVLRSHEDMSQQHMEVRNKDSTSHMNAFGSVYTSRTGSSDLYWRSYVGFRLSAHI